MDSTSDPIRACDGCEIVADYLEGSYYYAMELQSAGQDFSHIIPQVGMEASVCSTSYLSHFELREDIFGFNTFVHKSVKRGGKEGPLNELCLEIFREKPALFRRVLSTGEKGAFCDSSCSLSKQLSILERVHFSLRKGSKQTLRLVPYAILLLLVVTVTLQYLHSILNRLLRTKAKKNR